MARSSFRFFPVVHEQRYVRRYREQLLHQNILAHSTPLLPHLERLPLLMYSAQHPEPLSLAEALRLSPRIRLVSDAHTAQTLILRQFCLHWAKNQALVQRIVPLLTRVPTTEVPPEAVLRRTLQTFGFPADLLMLRRGLATGVWLLLLEGWSELAAERHDVWRDWVLTMGDRYPALSVVVATGPISEAWPDFDDWLVQPLADS